MTTSGKIGGLVLAGGTSRRMGQDKALLDWGGRRAVDLVCDLARQICGDEVLVAGGDYGQPFIPDPSPLAGPVGGLLAGARVLAERGCQSLLVLAVDAPTLTLADLDTLLAAPAPGAIYEDLPLPMWLTIDAIPAEAEAGWPLRRLAERAGLSVLDCPPDIRRRARGANDPAERAALLAELDLA